MAKMKEKLRKERYKKKITEKKSKEIKEIL